MEIAVVALGKIGLPLAVQFAESGHNVHGADISQRTVDLINSAQVPFPGEADLDTKLAEQVAAGRLDASTDVTTQVARSEVVVVVVPLIVDDQARPDFTAMDAATDAIGKGLTAGTLVSYETTLPVGTTRDRFAPRLAELSGLTLGEDLFVCFSPERVYSGRIFADLRKYPKVVGGLDAASTKRAIDFYEAVLQFNERDDLARPNGVWDVGTAEAAELVKLAETTYRDVNIGLANEFAVFARSRGIDIFSVIDAANSQPFSHIHQPGISVGGHCIPVYPRLYLSNDPSAVVPAASREANEKMPAYFAGLLTGALDKPISQSRVLVLGLAYRGAVKEWAFSGTFPLVEELRRLGATVFVNDPLYDADELRAFDFEPSDTSGQFDAVVLHTDHPEYLELVPASFEGLQVMVDGRGVLDPSVWTDAGVRYLSLLPE
ncbi:MAG: nucleotide sugar dehydrogenase [Microthrixaceae bacterium]|nr:nucleotide sugar dehydrogenase [Microthrixaceae bacterium]